MDQIRWRVTYQDPGVSNFVAGGRDGRDLSGEGSSSEIIEALKKNLDDEIDAQVIEAWISEQEPASAGGLATFRLTDSLGLEIIVKDAGS